MSSFSLLLGLGVLVGLSWIALQSPPALASRRIWAASTGLVGSLVGGRAIYVAVHWAYFWPDAAGGSSHLAEIPQIWLGGLSGAGALAGGLAAVLGYAVFSRQSPGALADALLPLLAGLGAAAWLGCWRSGIAYSAPLKAWWALAAPDEWGRVAPRLPLQPLAALFSVVVVWLAESLAWLYELRRSGKRLRLVMGDDQRPLAEIFPRPAGLQRARRNIPGRLSVNRPATLGPTEGSIVSSKAAPLAHRAANARLVRGLRAHNRPTAGPTHGLRASLALLGLGLVWLFVATLRADPIPMWRDRPLDTWFGLALTSLASGSIAIILLFQEIRTWKHNETSRNPN